MLSISCAAIFSACRRPQVMAETLRAFIAIPLPPNLRAALTALQQELQQQPLLQTARWSNPETWHLTLAFLGEITEELLDQCTAVMLSVSDSQSAFDLRVATLGAFPSSHHARVLWVGIDGGTPLLTLQQRLAAGLAGIGLAIEDRPFTPHLTLARFKTPLRLQPFPAFPTVRGGFRAEQFNLYQSRLTPQGAIHTIRASAALALAPTLSDDHTGGLNHE